MGATLRLENNTEHDFSIEHKNSSVGRAIYASDITISVDTISDMTSLVNKYDGLAVLVRDLKRGGAFIYDSTRTTENDGGVIFDGWARQYQGRKSASWYGVTKKNDIFDELTDNLEYMEKYATFDLSQTPNTGNLQGLTIHDNKLYVHKNVKDGDGSYAPSESGKIYRYDLGTGGTLSSPIVKEISKFGHQGFESFLNSSDELCFLGSGGTDDGQTVENITEYSGVVVSKYMNAGKKISIYNWGSGTSTRIRVMADYDSGDTLNTKWYHAVPTLDTETNVVAIVFSDGLYSPRKMIRYYNLSDILAGDETAVVSHFKEITLRVHDVVPTGELAFQGVTLYNGDTFLLFGDSSVARPKKMIIVSPSGNVRKTVDFSVPSVDSQWNSVVEPEGLTIAKFNGVPFLCGGINVKKIVGGTTAYKGYLYRYGIGDTAHSTNSENLSPSTTYSSSATDVAIRDGEAYSIRTWDPVTEESTFVSNVTSSGNAQYKGSYLAMKATDTAHDAFKPLSYSTDANREFLQIRGWKKSLADGAGINLYGRNDDSGSGTHGPDMYLYGSDFKFKTAEDTPIDLAKLSDQGNLHIKNSISLDYDGTNSNRVLNRNGNILELRAKDSNGHGAGINLYDENHASIPFSIKMFIDNTNGGNLILNTLPTSDPSVVGAVWNDSGTLKISQ